MKRTIIYLLSLSILGHYTANSQAQVAEATIYRPIDGSIKALLDEHSDDIAQKCYAIYKRARKHGHGVWTFDWLPGYYVKYDLARIEGLALLKKCIENYNLSSITVPDKQVYHIKGRPIEYSNRNYAIVVKAVEASKNPQPVTLNEVQQLCTIMHKTKYLDMKRDNYIRTVDGKICLIDTEGTFDRTRLFSGFERMITQGGDLNRTYTEDALKHIFWELKQQLKKNRSQIKATLQDVKEALLRQPKPLAWDYISYFKEYFKALKKMDKER